MILLLFLLICKKTHIRRCKSHLFFIVPVHPMIVVDAAGCRSAVLIAHFPFDTGSILSDTRIICFWRLPDFVPILLSFATEPELVLIPSQYPCEG